MTRKLIVFFLATLISLPVFSQHEKAIVMLSGGAGLAVGEFAAKDVKDKYSGLAKSGSVLQATVSFPMWRRMGVIAAFISQSNPTDAASYDKQFGYYYYNYNLTYTSTFTNWIFKSALLGVYGTIPMSGRDKWYFDYRFLGGLTSASSPELRVKVQQGNVKAEGVMSPEKASAVSYLFGIGFRCNLYKRFCIGLTADYFGTKPTFKNNVLIVNNRNVIVFDSYSQPINTFNLQAGIGYRF